MKALTLVRPTLTLVRRADGAWNLADLLPLTPPDPPPACPAWDVRDATVKLVFETGDRHSSDRCEPGAGPLAATLHGVNLTLLPESRRSYRVRGTGGVSGATGEAGGVRFDGAVDLDRGAWRLSGNLRGLELGGGLLADAALGSPELQAGLLAAREKLSEAERKLAGEMDPFAGVEPVRVASLGDGGPLVAGGGGFDDGSGPVRLTDFGLEGDLSAEFSLSAASFTEVPEYDVTVRCRSGTLTNRFLPFPLTGVRGTARVAGGEVRLTEASGRHGATRARAEGVFRPTPLGLAGRVTLSAERVPVTANDRDRLPEVLRKLHETLGPTGTADVRVCVLESEPGVEHGVMKQRWELRELDVTVTDGTARPEKFPYLVEDVRGTARTDGDGVLRLDFRGTAAGRPGMFTGWVRHPGKRCEFRGEVKAVGVPLDRAFRDALPPDVREAVEHMGLSGEADPTLELHRPPGEDRDVNWRLTAAVRGARVRSAAFPYPIDGLSGAVRFDSADGVWKFTDLAGKHGPAALTGEAAFDLSDGGPGRLELSVVARNVPLDRSLRAALPDGPAAVWDLLAPSGTADVRAEVGWTPGRDVRVAAPAFRVRGGSVTLEPFPLPLREVNVTGSYLPDRSDVGAGRVTIGGFGFAHADRGTAPDGSTFPVTLRTSGRGEASHESDGGWSVSFDDVWCDGFVTGPALLTALPDGLRGGAESIDLRGPVNLRVPSAQLRGYADDPAATTAAWQAAADLAGPPGGNTACLGPTVALGAGVVTCEGSYDGLVATLKGELRAASATAYDHTLTDVEAPFAMRGDVLTVGSPGDPNGRHAKAVAYGGFVRADATANLAAGPDYRLSASLNGARLAEYAARHMGSADGLRGNVRASATLAGRGDDLRTVVGRGGVEVQPAALGTLPVVLRLFKAVNMGDPTAFDSAAAEFDLADEAVTFRRVDLRGQAISFVGRGRIERRGDLNLQFYSRPPTTVGRIPLINRLATGWIGVDVTGTVGAPAVKTFNQPVDASLRAFLTPLSPMLRGPPPRTAGGR